jgi:TRAP-type C4-dicarboxylate transport system permease small subunit
MTRVSPLPRHDDQSMATGGGALSVANIIDRAVGFVCQAMILLTGIALLAILTANVVARYVLESGGFRFAQELPERLFPWFIMAGVALAVQKGGHMAVESVLARLSRNGARMMLLVGFAIIIASYAILGWEAIGVADIVSIETSPVLGLSSSYSYYALALGCIAVILTTFALALRVAVIGPEAMPTPDPEETGI